MWSTCLKPKAAQVVLVGLPPHSLHVVRVLVEGVLQDVADGLPHVRLRDSPDLWRGSVKSFPTCSIAALTSSES